MGDDNLVARWRQDLPRLAALDGVSGHEASVVSYLHEALTPLADRVEVDTLGNLYAEREGGPGPHLLVAAHSDEIGALVAAVEPDGFLRLEPVGGVGEALLVGRKVRVHGYLGVIGVRPGHLASAEEARTAPPAGELYVDLGVESAAEVAALGIRPGDALTWKSEVEPTANPDRLVGKGIDNRIGCLIALELLRTLQGMDLPGRLTVAVAVQEEVGLRGARIVARRVRPDAALVVDTVPCTDTPDSRHVNSFPVRLGAGPLLQVSSGQRGREYLMSEPLRDWLLALAEQDGIPVQVAPFPFGSNDAAAVYAEGIPVAPITIPRRYSHSPVEMLDLRDAVATFRLTLAVVRQGQAFPRGLLAQ